MTLTDHAIYASLWVLFGCLHSVLASGFVKERLGFLGRSYRLIYNLFAVLHLAVTFLIGEWVLGATSESIVKEPWSWLLTGVMVLGGIVLIMAMRLYDGGRFLGFTQFRHTSVPEDEPLRVEGLHQYVRHPLYSGAILLLWGRVGTEVELATAIWTTLYFVVGAHFEEQRLIVRYGDAYRDYRAKVPGFVPWKGRRR